MITPKAEKETLACLIIDDPLLRPKYGCLDYEKLLGEMKVHNFFTEIAFIPWNYKRSDPKTVNLFANNTKYFAICVHGCNHLQNEFGMGNYQELSALSSTALWRMNQHERLTGLKFDPVIVFPHGRFSSIAMLALKDNGYVGAFNSTLQTTHGEEPKAIEYLRPATTIYHDFPLFLRRYPNDKSGFSQDISNGRPILIVEHHTAFRNGYKPITDFVDWINNLGNIRWTSLLNISEYYLGKNIATVGQNDNLAPSTFRFNTKVLLRRLLCEARDNFIETNNFLPKLYQLVRG